MLGIIEKRHFERFHVKMCPENKQNANTLKEIIYRFYRCLKRQYTDSWKGYSFLQNIVLEEDILNTNLVNFCENDHSMILREISSNFNNLILKYNFLNNSIIEIHLNNDNLNFIK
jgi:hypothetical protein